MGFTRMYMNANTSLVIHRTLLLVYDEKYPIDSRRNAGAKPRYMEVSLDKRPVAEKSGRTIDTPTEEQQNKNSINAD